MRLVECDELYAEFRRDIMGGLNWDRILREAKAVDAVPVRRGEWLSPELIPDSIDGHTYAECSECHKIRIVDNFCPNCGADMRGEQS